MENHHQFQNIDLDIDDNRKGFDDSRVQDLLCDSLVDENQQNERIYSRLFPTKKTNLSMLENSNISILTDHLILTSASNVIPDVIDTLRVNCVISAAPELPSIPLNTNYHRIDVMDSPNSHIGSYLDEAADLIHEISSTGGRILVFCVAGVSRSATLCIAYLMKYHRLTLKQAYDYVKLRRPRIKPNCGFFKQLIEFEKKMFINSSVQMVFNEFVQMYIPDVYDGEYQVIRRKFRR